MGYRTRKQIEAHDAAGYETDYINFAACDDGYGNQVEHGDLSVQRMVGGGVREAGFPKDHPDNPTPKAYDHHPFQSKAQHRKFRSMEARGDIARGTSDRWAKHTAGGVGGLPEKKR